MVKLSPSRPQAAVRARRSQPDPPGPHRYGVENILFVLDEAPNVQALAIPRYRLHPLKGEFKGYWSVTVKANWRIIFRFEEGYAYGVELIDYH